MRSPSTIAPIAFAALLLQGCAALHQAKDEAAITYHRRQMERAEERQQARVEEEETEAAREACCRERVECCDDYCAPKPEVERVSRQELRLAINETFQLERVELDLQQLEQIQQAKLKEHEDAKKLWKKLDEFRRKQYDEQQIESMREFIDADCDCARPEPVMEPYRSLPEPELEPITSSEIPLVMRMRLGLGLEQPEIERATVERRVKCPEPECPPKRPCVPRTRGCDDVDCETGYLRSRHYTPLEDYEVPDAPGAVEELPEPSESASTDPGTVRNALVPPVPRRQ